WRNRGRHSYAPEVSSGRAEGSTSGTGAGHRAHRADEVDRGSALKRQLRGSWHKPSMSNVWRLSMDQAPNGKGEVNILIEAVRVHLVQRLLHARPYKQPGTCGPPSPPRALFALRWADRRNYRAWA